MAILERRCTLSARHALIVCLLTACRAGAPHAAEAGDTSAASRPSGGGALESFVYVTNEDGRTVSVISTATNQVVAIIPVGMRPRGVRVSDSGRRVYVALSGSPRCPPSMPDRVCDTLKTDRSQDGIAEIDAMSRRVIRTLPSGSDPEQFDVSPDGKRLYVANEDAGTASIIDVARGVVLMTAPVGKEPEGVRVGPGAHVTYVTSETNSTVTAIDAKSGQVLSTIHVGKRPRDVMFLPDARRYVVSAEVGGTVQMIDTHCNCSIMTLAMPIGAKPMGIAIAPDGQRVYVTTGRFGTVEVIDIATQRIVGSVKVGTRPWGIGITSDGGTLYVANGPSNTVSVVDTKTLPRSRDNLRGRSPMGSGDESADIMRCGVRSARLSLSALNVIGLCTIGAAPRALCAQDTTQVQRADSSRPRAYVIPSVQVTVLRTPFDVSAIPFAADVVTPRDASAARPGLSLDEVLGHLAGVQADNRLNFALGDRIAIRGLGARAQFGVRGVRVIVDDIPATLADGQTVLNNVDLGSFGTAQVLRGPVSTIYGNASGGVIVLESAPAPPALFAPRLQLLTGSDELRHVQLGAGGTRRAWHYLLNGDQLDYGGYRAFSDARNGHVNTVVGYDTPRLRLKFVANIEHHNAKNPGSLSDSLLHVDRQQAFANNIAQETGERGTQVQGGTSAQLQLPYGELHVSGYMVHRTLTNPIPPSIIELARQAGGVRSAYAVTTKTGRTSVTTLFGIESDLQHDNRQNYVNVHGTSGAATLNQREHVTSVSPFVQMTGTFGPATVFGGVRYDRFRFSVDDQLITATNPDDSGARTLSAVSPAVGVSYAVVRDMTVYANATTAFQTPTTTELANRPDGAGGFNPSLDPEHVHSLEAGIRGILGIRNTYHISIYRMRVAGELAAFEVPSSPGRTFYRNTAIAEHRGIEVDDRIHLMSQLSVHVSYTRVHTRIVDDTAMAGANIGKRVPGIAPDIGTVSLDIGQSSERFASLEVRAEVATPANDLNTVSSAGYAVMNMRMSIPVAKVGVAFIGGIGNILDARYNTSVVINATGGRYFEPAAERTFYVGATWMP